MAKDNTLTAENPESARTLSFNGGTLRPFQPGQSGNPGGRTKLEGEMMKRCREAGPAAADFLIGVALGRVPEANVRERIVAAGMVLDRAFGKVKELPPEDEKTSENAPDTEELRRGILQLLSDRNRSEPVTFGASPAREPPVIAKPNRRDDPPSPW